jgi:hypothetical protein
VADETKRVKRMHFSVRKLLEMALAAMPNVVGWEIVKRDGIPRVRVELSDNALTEGEHDK